MPTRSRAVSLLAAVAIASPATAQGRLLHVDRFTTEQGLAQNTVSAVAQDSAGYIWVATPRGLQRFDGYSFVQYTSLDPRAPAELEGHIHMVRVDSHGNRWIATSESLFRLGGRGERALTRVHTWKDVARFVMDSAGRLWFLERGVLSWVDMNAERPRAVTALADSTLDRCWALVATRRGTVWLGCERDSSLVVMHLDPTTNRSRSYPLDSLAVVNHGREDQEGRLWIGGDRGLLVLDPGADRFRMVEAFREIGVPQIVLGRGPSLLVPTDRWLARIDLNGRIIERWDPREVFAEAPLPRDITVDREGGFWIATTTAGLVRLDPTRPVFDHLSTRTNPPLPVSSDFVTALRETRDGALWGGTIRGGAFRASSDGSKLEGFRHDPHRPSSLAADEVWDFEEDHDGNLWLATAGGLCRAEPPEFACYRPPGDGVGDIARSSTGRFWLARGSLGVTSFDPATGTFGAPVRQPRYAVSVYADSDSGYLWIGAERLFRGRVRGGELVLPLDTIPSTLSPTPAILDMHRNGEGALWLATESGLQRWDVANRRFVPVSIPELSATTVFSIEEDDRGRLWLGTAHGIVEYSPSTGIARRYGRQDGVRSGEFNRRAALRRKNGDMVFGGVYGLTIFRPELVTRRRGAPPVVFTRWRKVTAEGAVDASLDGIEEVRLGPGDRTFTLDFAALTFAPGPARRYRYRLKGLSDDWIESPDHSVIYATPPPGRYVFEVQAAAGSDGAWAEPGASLGLVVVPPFWGTWWFRGLVAAALMALLWSLHRLRLRQAVAVERLRLQISRDLHDEIGAGLSSIALLSDAVATRGAGDPGRAQLARIGESARLMVADLRDIVWAIDPNADRLEDIVSRMQDVSGDLLPGIPIEFHAPPREQLSTTVGLAERKELLLIFKELLHNVARHARASAVRIELASRGDELRLVVADDGRGFDPASARAGRGLRSIRERAARLGARFEVESGAGRGTTAMLALRRT